MKKFTKPKVFKIALSKDDKRRIRDIILDTYSVNNYQPEHSTRHGLATLCSENIVDFIESIDSMIIK